MLNCLFYSMFFLLFLNVSYGSLRLSQVNRAFQSIYKGDFEASVVTVDENGEPTYPYYNQTMLRNYIKQHLEPNISKYTTNYLLNLTFYKDSADKPCQSNEKARRAKISIEAKINYLFNYKNERDFSIKSKDNL